LNFVEELGERKIIDLILECLDHMPNVSVPFGDDVSAIDLGHGKLAVMKTDMLIGKTDVPEGMSLQQAARKAVVMNISDLAAKGVQPLAILAAIGLPRGLSRKEIQQIGKGLNAGAREYNAYVLGGDTNEASDLVISCAAFGICEKSRLVRRSGAKPGDYVAVTGFFGKTASGLKILMEDFSAPPEIRRELVNSVIMPNARLKEGLALAQTRVTTSSIDSSDGLAWSLHEISMASKVGFLVDHLPIAKEAQKLSDVINTASQQIDGTRATLKTLQDHARQNRDPKNREIMQASRELDKKLEELAEILNPTPPKQGIADRSAGLRMQVMRATRGMSGGHEPISQAANVRYEKAKPKVEEFLQKVNDVYKTDVENFKKLLREADFSLFKPFTQIKVEEK